MVRGLTAPSCSDNQNFDIMKTIVRAICAIIGMVAFCVLLGEPAESVTRTECILMKAGSLLCMWVAFKVYVRTLSEGERRKIEDEQV